MKPSTGVPQPDGWCVLPSNSFSCREYAKSQEFPTFRQPSATMHGCTRLVSPPQKERSSLRSRGSGDSHTCKTNRSTHIRSYVDSYYIHRYMGRNQVNSSKFQWSIVRHPEAWPYVGSFQFPVDVCKWWCVSWPSPSDWSRPFLADARGRWLHATMPCHTGRKGIFQSDLYPTLVDTCQSLFFPLFPFLLTHPPPLLPSHHLYKYTNTHIPKHTHGLDCRRVLSTNSGTWISGWRHIWKGVSEVKQYYLYSF